MFFKPSRHENFIKDTSHLTKSKNKAAIDFESDQRTLLLHIKFPLNKNQSSYSLMTDNAEDEYVSII